MKEIKIGSNEEGQRFDRFLLKYFNNSNRSNIYKLIRKKVFKINGERTTDEAYFLKNGDVISVFLSDESLSSLIKPEKKITPERVGLEIVYEDEEILVVNKPRGLLTHPDRNEYKETLTTKVLIYLNKYVTRTFKPASIQRLDKNTGGIVIFCKTYEALKKYNALMRDRKIEKYYLAVVEGDVSVEGEIEGILTRNSEKNISYIKTQDCDIDKDDKGKYSKTTYRPVQRFGKYTLLEVKIETGRTHQIRVSLSKAGHPIVADIKYGAKPVKNVKHQLLHGYKVVAEDKVYETESGEIREFIQHLKNNKN